MVDRYDENSEENVNRYEDVTDASSDVWASLVTHITGYPVPDRSTIFDTLRSDHGGKLFRMDIRDRGLGSFVQDASGFLRNTGEDYDIWFFDSGKRTQIKQARIVFEGRVRAGDELIFADPGTDDVANASVREGNEFKDYNKDEMSTVALARYMNGPRTALLELRGGNTGNARFSNLGVAEDAAVDLKSFDTTGQSFDFAAQFFRDQGPKIKEWEDALGREDATWKGEAAEVFRSLLTKIRENYDAYIETFDETPSTGEGDGTGKTVYSRALSQARQALENAADKLLDAWITWANSDYYDPHRVLRYVLDDLAVWVDANNVANTEIKTTYSAYSSSTYHDPKEGFSQNHPEYGDLTDIANWAKVGDKAVQIWSRGVDEYLVKPARSVQSTLNNTFLDLSGDFTENVPEPKSTSTASQEYEERKAEEAQDEINRQNEENRRYQDELREEQNRQREEDKRYQDELREEQNRQREEDKRYQDELREEQNRQREEDRRYQDELRAEQEKQADEAQEQLRTFNDRTTTDLDGLDDVLNRNVPVTESLGDVGGINGGGDGSLTQNLGALGDANNAVNESLAGLGDTGGTGGGDQRTAVPPTANLGSLGGLNSGGGTRTPSDRTTGLVGGDPVARFPDGSSTRFDPDTGLLTTTGPDGTTTTTDLGNGLQVTNPDGSVTSLTDDGKLTTTFPDGRTETIDPSTGRAVTTSPDGTTTTTDLGSLGDLNSGAGGGVLDTPTGGTTQLTGGELTSRFPDGSSTSFDPDTGTLTTTGPDGSVTTTDLGNGLQVTNPDGSVTSLGDDGNLTTTFPDGTTQSIDPSTGRAVTTSPDGTTTTTDLGSLGDLNGRSDLSSLGDLPTQSNGDLSGLGDLDLGSLDGLNSDTGSGLRTPTGGETSLAGDDLLTRFPDGTRATFDTQTGMLTATHPDGSVTTTDLTHGVQVNNPDGSVTSLDNGMLTTEFPDGSTQVVDPETGIATVTDAQGNTETVNLNDLNTGNTQTSSVGGGIFDELDALDTLGGGGGVGGGTSTETLSPSDLNLSNGGSLGPATGAGLTAGASVGTDGLVTGAAAPLSDGTTATGGSLGPVAASGTAGAPGMPGTPGMPMGGMGGAGGGGDKGNGERVRAVLVDAAEESERRNRRRRSPWNRQEDSDTFLSPASRVATTGGDSPEEEATDQGRRVTTSADYLEEDADVWGTEDGGTPAVIGR
ncbi:AAWKG family protein [Streptomyces althioticus]|uniref:AAWKG family protein n=1 Tax=Streptomyces althioticus TaxID=83380 RepID=UPI00331B409F